MGPACKQQCTQMRLTNQVETTQLKPAQQGVAAYTLRVWLRPYFRIHWKAVGACMQSTESAADRVHN